MDHHLWDNKCRPLFGMYALCLIHWSVDMLHCIIHLGSVRIVQQSTRAMHRSIPDQYISDQSAESGLLIRRWCLLCLRRSACHGSSLHHSSLDIRCLRTDDRQSGRLRIVVVAQFPFVTLDDRCRGVRIHLSISVVVHCWPILDRRTRPADQRRGSSPYTKVLATERQWQWTLNVSDERFYPCFSRWLFIGTTFGID